MFTDNVFPSPQSVMAVVAWAGLNYTTHANDQYTNRCFRKCVCVCVWFVEAFVEALNSVVHVAAKRCFA